MQILMLNSHSFPNNCDLIGWLNKFNPYIAGVDFSRQTLTSVDVRFWRLKSTPAP